MSTLSPVTARTVAVKVLTRVETQGAFANQALATALARSGLNRRDRAFATELTYGALRWRGRLDWYAQALVKRPFPTLDPKVRNAIRVGLYQLRILTGVPERAAIHETVEAVKALANDRAAGFVNAVLRAAQRQSVPLPTGADAESLAVRESHPQWLVARWIARYGYEGAAALCRANNQAPPLVVRVNPLRATAAQVRSELAAMGVQVEPGLLSPWALVLDEVAGLESLPAHREGRMVVQDESSQLVAAVLAPQPGERVIDLCSAPGGKATHLAAMMENRGELLALDIHHHKVKLVAEAAARTGAKVIQAHVGDAAHPPPAWRGTAQRVLLDAPCSGTGVLRRRPDLRWRKAAEDLDQLVAVQRQLLLAACDLLAPGGVLVYSTCSLEPEECHMNVLWLLNERQGRLKVMPVLPRLPELARMRLAPRVGDEPWLYLLPHRDQVDGFFISALVVD